MTWAPVRWERCTAKADHTLYRSVEITSITKHYDTMVIAHRKGRNPNSLLLHRVLVALFFALALLALRNVNGFDVDVVIGAQVRVADDV